jgi:2-polyprenyl-3-methyl-5-hydroxy-6-metoxy-1,4-benzoquinol methylase
MPSKIEIPNWIDTPQYIELFASNLKYGVGGRNHFNLINSIAQDFGIKSIFDFGCGRGTLLEELNKTDKYKLSGYDPTSSNNQLFSNTINDEPVDMIVSTDVLEHLYEFELNNCFKIFKIKTPILMFHRICGRVASNILPNNTNAHKTVKSYEWWQDVLTDSFQEYNIYGQISPSEIKIFSFLLVKTNIDLYS